MADIGNCPVERPCFLADHTRVCHTPRVPIWRSLTLSCLHACIPKIGILFLDSRRRRVRSFLQHRSKAKYFVSMILLHTSDDEMTLRSDHGYPCTSKPSKTAIVDSKQADADIVQVLMAPYRPAFRETKVDLMAGLCGHVFTARSALVGQLWSLGALSITKGKDSFFCVPICRSSLNRSSCRWRFYTRCWR